MKFYSLFFFLIFLFASCMKPQGETSPVSKSMEGREVVVYTTTKDSTLRLTQSATHTFGLVDQPVESEVHVFVNPNHEFQSFLGIGAAITDASAEVYAKLPEAKQAEFMKAHFDTKDGLGYTLIRTNIHSCDFSSGSYTYIEEGDKELKTFSIEHDRQFRIPMIKKAMESAGGKLTLYASPWSPPAFMKSNNHMLRGGKLLPEFYPAWAMYFAKFIKAYEAEGIPIWGLTIQNEPMATQTWESCIWTAEEERDFLKMHLGPTLEKEGLGDKEIIIWDHNRDLINHRVNTILDDPDAAKYAWGIGFHWYETWAGGEPMFDNLKQVKENYPNHHLIFTEGCAERYSDEHISYWPNAERYGKSMINDFNSGTVGWTDWNILLDERGGPNHVGNFCFAPVHANTQTGELIYTPIYYYIGHFSKFIRPEAKRISTASSRSHLLSTSFRNKDGKIATVVMNQSDMPITYNLYVGYNNAITEHIPAHSIQTLLY